MAGDPGVGGGLNTVGWVRPRLSLSGLDSPGILSQLQAEVGGPGGRGLTVGRLQALLLAACTLGLFLTLGDSGA